ncbi:uncharacterized protein [Pyxicephalus adspersus]|uniref:uncharacterized protein isoform X6 n=1 Tax=Pyxicephalus adspersus TaxID=30357 RepID=UPI003B5913E4
MPWIMFAVQKLETTHGCHQSSQGQLTKGWARLSGVGRTTDAAWRLHRTVTSCTQMTGSVQGEALTPATHECMNKSKEPCTMKKVLMEHLYTSHLKWLYEPLKRAYTSGVNAIMEALDFLWMSLSYRPRYMTDTK